MKRPSRHVLPLLDALAEKHIGEAQARGEFKDLPGSGEPLDLGDDTLVPEELRPAWRLLKNAGCLPPELETHAEIRDIETLLRAASSEYERGRLLARLRFLLLRAPLGRRNSLKVEADYAEKIAEKLDRSR
ncbi:MAG: DUF1992 domain-containing protein [Burkholderiales bacterium]|nr:DUF1992 domain-containing protein [Rubrivivax sp.]MDP2398995.1 DUF1992 domain-containing protein [Burkholderiales bacterium]